MRNLLNRSCIISTVSIGYDGASSDVVFVSHPFDATIPQWVDIVATWSISQAQANLYVNGGTPATGVLSSAATNVLGTTKFEISGYNSLPNVAFTGIISHFMLYNLALSARDVETLQQSPYAMFEHRPVWMDYLHLQEGYQFQ